jgi:hypothetical protein
MSLGKQGSIILIVGQINEEREGVGPRMRETLE